MSQSLLGPMLFLYCYFFAELGPVDVLIVYITVHCMFSLFIQMGNQKSCI